MAPQFGFSVLSIVIGGALIAADPPRPTPESVRGTIKQLWSNNGGEAAAAVTALEADPLALPVMRRVHATDPNPRHQGDLERLIAKAVAGRDKVLSDRIEQWARDGRLDLLTEVRSLTDGKAAEAAIDHLLRAGTKFGEVGEELLKARCPKPPRAFLLPLPWADGEALKKSTTKPLFDVEIALPEEWGRTDRAVYGDRIDMPGAELRQSLVVCRSELKHLARTTPTRVGRCQWRGSLVFANTGVTLEAVGGCVVVLDGDLELKPSPGGELLGSVVVVNGNITEHAEGKSTRIATSVVWATGDITLVPYSTPHHCSAFFAGGKLADAEKLAEKGCVEENVKEPPLPVRFLDPAEFGLTVEATKGGMKVAKVADKSCFADAGLKVGDVIAKVGEVDTTTAPAFRRELRRGVVEGAVLLDVVRGQEKVELLVAVPDVPAAPKKDKDLKATPPDKK